MDPALAEQGADADGEDTAAMLAELGLDEATTTRLRNAGVNGG